MTDDRPHLLLIHSGHPVYREHMVRSLASRYRVHLFSHRDMYYEQPYLVGWSVLSSTTDIDLVVASAKELHAKDPLDAVLSLDESRTLQAAHVAAALGLPGDPAYVGRCRDKHQTRQALAAAGVPQPASALCETVDDALAAAEKFGYPVILKPRNLAGSMGVIKVHNPAELAEQWPFTHGTSHPDALPAEIHVLVEEFVDGYEVSVDAAVHNGHVSPMCLARKKIGFPPYAEEIGHTIDPQDPLLSDPAFLDLLHGTHRALGFLDGFTHTEIMVTADGPKLIEVNARVGGDLIPLIGQKSTGIDAALAAADCAAGREPDMTPTLSRCSAIRFFYVDEDDTELATIGFDPDVAVPPEIDEMKLLFGPGAVVAPPPHGTVWARIAYITAVGDTVEKCEAAIDTAATALYYTAAEKKPE